MKKAFLLFLPLLLMTTTRGLSQSQSFSIFPIVQKGREASFPLAYKYLTPVYSAKNEVQGYVFMNEKPYAQEFSLYQIAIMNNSLEVVLEQSIDVGNGFSIVEAYQMDDYYSFRLLRSGKIGADHLYLVLNKEGNIIFQREFKTYFNSEPTSQFPSTQMSNRNNTIQPIEGQGFLLHSLVREKISKSYLVYFVSINSEKENWLYIPEKSKKTQTIEYVGIEKDIVFNLIYEGDTHVRKDAYIQALNFKTGKQLYRNKITTKVKGIIPFNFSTIKKGKDGNFHLYAGEYRKSAVHSVPYVAVGDATTFFYAQLDGQDGLSYQASIERKDLRTYIKKQIRLKYRGWTILNTFRTPDKQTYLIIELIKGARTQELLFIQLNENLKPVATRWHNTCLARYNIRQVLYSNISNGF